MAIKLHFANIPHWIFLVFPFIMAYASVTRSLLNKTLLCISHDCEKIESVLSACLFDQTPGGAAKRLLPILLFARRSFPCIITSFWESSANTNAPRPGKFHAYARNGIGAERREYLDSTLCLIARSRHGAHLLERCLTFALCVSSPTAPP